MADPPAGGRSPATRRLSSRRSPKTTGCCSGACSSSTSTGRRPDGRPNCTSSRAAATASAWRARACRWTAGSTCSATGWPTAASPDASAPFGAASGALETVAEQFDVARVHLGHEIAPTIVVAGAVVLVVGGVEARDASLRPLDLQPLGDALQAARQVLEEDHAVDQHPAAQVGDEADLRME